ncbi:MAG: hypothetical protein O9346_05780 [Leptospiraceae bacterium]|jgi:hypothetical protein|nr:hypothetical protein [Leptospiraceae bacterium]MCZ8345907.1 hypothetical protein [Leptospiraceae bacterium]
MKQFIVCISMLFALGNCATYHVQSASSIGDNVYMTVRKDSGNPYDPDRFKYKILKCKSQSDDNLLCSEAQVKGMSEYGE